MAMDTTLFPQLSMLQVKRLTFSDALNHVPDYLMTSEISWRTMGFGNMNSKRK